MAHDNSGRRKKFGWSINHCLSLPLARDDKALEYGCIKNQYQVAQVYAVKHRFKSDQARKWSKKACESGVFSSYDDHDQGKNEDP